MTLEADDILATPMDLEDSRYLLLDPRDISRVLQALVDSRALISARIMPGGLPCPTALLALDHEEGTVLLDGNRQESVNQRVVQAHHLTCVSQLDRVRVQFRLTQLQRVQHEGMVAFTAPIPDRVLQLQRRELYRLPLVPGPNVTLEVPQSAEGPALQMRVLDLSGGGLALLVRDGQELRFRPGTALSGCLLRLPEAGEIPVDLQVAHLSRQQPLAGASQRAGCRFLGLVPVAEKRILQYIFRVERQRKARERGVA